MGWIFDFRKCGDYHYLYLVQKGWVPGKGPRNVKQIYIGNADRLQEKLTQPPRHLKSFPLGKTAALVHAARRSGLWDSLLRHLPTRSAHEAWLLLAQVIARVEKPVSREGMARLFPETSLPLFSPWTRAPSGRVLRAVLRDLYGTGEKAPDGDPVITRARVRAIQEDVFHTLLSQGLEPDLLVFDGTNEFFHHQAGRWTRKGKAKSRRYDKNLVGLGMVTVGTIPILSEVEEGNRNDMDTFPEVFDALLKRLEHLDVATERLKMVVDRGVNSVDNFDDILGAMHVVASLKRNEAKELFQLPLGGFRPIGKDTKEREVLGQAGAWEGFERNWRALVTYRPGEARRDAAKWEQARSKVLARVVKFRRERPHKKQKVAMTKLVDAIPKEYRGIFNYRVEEVEVTTAKGKKVRRYRPWCEVDEKREAELKVSFGKTAIITDLEASELSDEALLEAAVARAEIEEQFKWLKDRFVISIKPMWVRHDAAVPGHLFVCVMGLMLLRYLQWEVRDLHLSMKEMVELLGKVRVAVARKDGKPQWVLEEMGMAEARLVSRLHLLDEIPKEIGIVS